eukprot:TRINITY_DN1954_c1_g1_i4.p1 TRINITY_DN1954_c1_g1~~TRINITY_DN1954_c1_g1_i4.p1  ORF type:complete len:562 (+),score=134.74 TRINITY_DN1954_c1_g1_i4:2701-4386(+)
MRSVVMRLPIHTHTHTHTHTHSNSHVQGKAMPTPPQTRRQGHALHGQATKPDTISVWDPLNGKEYFMYYNSVHVPTDKELKETSDRQLVHLASTLSVDADTSREQLISNIAAKRSQVLPTRGVTGYLNRDPGCAKRFFLCKDYQRGKCRRLGECNSLHVDRQAVATYRAQYPPSQIQGRKMIRVSSDDDGEVFEVAVERLMRPGQTGSDGVWVRVVSRDVDLSGLLTQTGEAGSYVCVDAAHMRHLRTLWQLPCCSDPSCQDSQISAGQDLPKGQDGLKIQRFVLGRTPAGCGLDATLLWPTKGLLELTQQLSGAESPGLVRVPMSRVCRPHIRKECKWGRSCNNVHLCRRSTAASTAMPGSNRNQRRDIYVHTPSESSQGTGDESSPKQRSGTGSQQQQQPPQQQPRATRSGSQLSPQLSHNSMLMSGSDAASVGHLDSAPVSPKPEKAGQVLQAVTISVPGQDVDASRLPVAQPVLFDPLRFQALSPVLLPPQVMIHQPLLPHGCMAPVAVQHAQPAVMKPSDGCFSWEGGGVGEQDDADLWRKMDVSFLPTDLLESTE